MGYLGYGYTAIALSDYKRATNALCKYVSHSLPPLYRIWSLIVLFQYTFFLLQVGLEPLDPIGHNMYGLSLEGQGLLVQAEKEFSIAIRLLQQQSTLDSGNNSTAGNNLSAYPLPASTVCIVSPPLDKKLLYARINRARVLSFMGPAIVNEHQQTIVSINEYIDTYSFL